MNTLRDCTPQETTEHSTYLKSTPVAQFGIALGQGRLILKKGLIQGYEDLGNSKTIFGELGGLKAQDLLNRSNFLVSDALEILTNPKCSDLRSLVSINYFLCQFDRKGINAKITFFKDENNLSIVDGNKRAIAVYNWVKDNPIDGFQLEVFIIETI